jgi:hypothetical protein
MTALASKLTLAAMLIGSVATGSVPAQACENAVQLKVHKAKQLLVEAEKQLQLGNPRKVLYALEETSTTDDAVNAEIELAVVVAGLRVGLDNVNRGNNPAKFIRLAYEENPTRPKLQALYAESLLRGVFRGTQNTKAAQQQRDAKALALLTDLEKRDLLPNAHAWAALARAHRKAGHEKDARAANERCAAVAINKSVCTWALASS